MCGDCFQYNLQREKSREERNRAKESERREERKEEWREGGRERFVREKIIYSLLNAA